MKTEAAAQPSALMDVIRQEQ
jgi:RNase P/RNase MRP subunit p29